GLTSGRDALAAFGVEQVHRTRLRPDAQRLARLRFDALAERAHDLLAGELGDHLRFRSGRLDRQDFRRQAVGVEVEMLGRVPSVTGRPLELGGAWVMSMRVPSPAVKTLPSILPLIRFIAGEPMKPATNRLA